LLPPIETPLESETILDLNQESLIRYWKTLHTWIEKEAEAAAMYQRIEHTACLWKEGKAGLWADPELKMALQWQQQAKPVPEWAKRYGNDFPLAMEFLEASVQNQKNQRFQMEREYQRMTDLERKYQRLQEDYAYQKEIEYQHELEIQNLRTRYRELDLKHERHLKEKNRRWKKAMLKVVAGSVVFVTAIVLIGGKWTLDTTIQSQREKQQAITMINEAQNALEKAELNSVTYKKMIAALFRFLSESDQNKTFFQWVKDTSAMETLLPGLRMMIDTAESINAEEKSYWNDRLFTIDEGKQVELLKILSVAASEIVNVKDNFRIFQVIVKNESGAIINPWEGTYLLKRGEKVLLDIAMKQSSAHNAKIEYSNIVKDSILSHATKTSSGLSMTYVASNVSGSRDLVLIKVLQADTGKIMDQKIVTFKVIESSLKGAEVPTN